MMQIKIFLLALVLSSAVCQDFAGHFPKLNTLVTPMNSGNNGPDLLAEAPTSIIVQKVAGDINVADYEYNEPCKIRQGFIALLDTESQPVEHKDVHGKVLRAQQVFAVLNEDTLTLFENQNANSLIKTVQLRSVDVPRKPRVWTNFHCFQLVAKDNLQTDVTKEDKEGVDVDLPETNGNERLSLCTGNKAQMDDWIASIVLFASCSIQTTDSSSSSSTTVVQTGSEKTKESSATLTVEITEINRRLQKIKESEERKSEAATRKKFEDLQIKEETEIKEQINKLSKKIIEENQKQRENEERINEERIKVNIETDKLTQEEQCLKDMLREKERREEASSEVQIKTSSIAQESSDMQQALNYISKTKAKETKVLERQHDDYLSEQDKKQAALKEQMVKDTIEAEKNTPYLQCIDEKTIVVKNKAEVLSAMCDKFAEDTSADPLIVKTCKNDNEHFCNACCHNHLGLIYMRKLLNCNTECLRVTSQDFEEEYDMPVKGHDSVTLGQLANHKADEDLRKKLEAAATSAVSSKDTPKSEQEAEGEKEAPAEAQAEASGRRRRQRLNKRKMKKLLRRRR